MYRLLLEKLIKDLILLQEEEYTKLGIKSFQDHESRTNVFIDALKSGKPIPLGAKGSTVVKQVIVKQSGVEATYDPKKDSTKLAQILPTLSKGDRLMLVGDDDKTYKITDVDKTIELGGKGKGGTLGPERAAVESLSKQLANIGEPITISFGGKTYKGIDGVRSVAGNRKADFAFTSGDTEVIFVSYKTGTTVKDIIFYGGITGVADSPEISAFIEAVKAKTPDFKGHGVEYGAPITDDNAILKTLYGSNYGTGTPNANNVQAILQGDLQLSKKGKVYTIESDFEILPPTIPDGPYEPYLNARYAKDRNQFGIGHCRITMIPKDSRKNIQNPFENET